MSDFDFDFGFTAVTEEELTVVQEAQKAIQTTTTTAASLEKELDSYKLKCDNLYNMIMPLLNNLAKNPEKDYISWPGKARLKKIEEFRDKLDEVYSG